VNASRRALWACFFCALAVRVAWVGLRCWQDGARLEFPDERLHWALAAHLTHAGALVSDDGRYAARMPVYPVFLALFAWLGTPGIAAARLAQAALGAAAAPLALWLAASAAGRRAGLVAAALVCLDPFAVFFSNLLLTETLFTSLGLALACATWALATRERPTRGQLLAFCALGPLALMTRPSAAPWILALWLLLAAWRGRQASVWLALAAMTLAAPLGAWGLRNQLVLGDPAWLSANGGVTLYDGQRPDADGGSDQTFLRTLPQLAGLDEIERDRVLRKLAVEQMRRDPGRVLRLAVVKLGRTWNPFPNADAYRAGPAAWAGAAFSVLLMGGAAFGTVCSVAAWKRRPGALGRLLFLCWTPLLYFTALHCIFVGSVRYRVPLMPFLGVLAALTLAAGSRRNHGAG